VVAAGAVDEYVDAAPLFENDLLGRLKTVAVKDVGFDGDAVFKPLLGELGAELLRDFTAQIENRHLGSVTEQIFGHARTKNTGRARADDDLSFYALVFDNLHF
jgi:hypothetical protein